MRATVVTGMPSTIVRCCGGSHDVVCEAPHAGGVVEPLVHEHVDAFPGEPPQSVQACGEAVAGDGLGSRGERHNPHAAEEGLGRSAHHEHISGRSA